jgi:hypothetical protein
MTYLGILFYHGYVIALFQKGARKVMTDFSTTYDNSVHILLLVSDDF